MEVVASPHGTCPPPGCVVLVAALVLVEERCLVARELCSSEDANDDFSKHGDSGMRLALNVALCIC